MVNEESTRSVEYQDILVLVSLPIQQVCQVLGCIMKDQKKVTLAWVCLWGADSLPGKEEVRHKGTQLESQTRRDPVC